MSYSPGARRATLEVLPVLANILREFGLPRSCAKVLAALYLFSRPLSSREIGEITGYSKSAVSAATRMLEGRNLILKVKSGRGFAYAPRMSLSQLVVEVQANLVEKARARVRELRKRVNSSLNSKLSALEEELSALLERLRGEARWR